ncbi:response regulator [soil metagenome]
MSVEKKIVLIIDDDITNIEVIGNVLEGDYEVIFATQGPEGIARARQVMPDIILLDIVMQEMDGYQVCSALKADPLTSDIPIIFVTSLDASEQEILGFEAGAIDYVKKPLNPLVLQARVRTQLKMKGASPASLATTSEASKYQGEEISERQKEILRWVHEGKTNWEIAQIVGSSETNIKYHMKKIMSKLDAFNRTQAAAKAVSLRVISFIDSDSKPES